MSGRLDGAGGKEDPRYLTRDDVCEMMSISRMHSYRLLADRKAPKPVKVGKRLRWKLEELERWIDSRKGR